MEVSCAARAHESPRGRHWPPLMIVTIIVQYSPFALSFPCGDVEMPHVMGASLVILALAQRRQACLHVPKRSKSLPCRWGSTTDPRYVTIPFTTMVEVLDFSLDNTYILMPDGTIKQQVSGIPMGDPLSPACAIGTCAWMEMEWMNSLSAESKQHFRAKRFMDDILCVYDASDAWKTADFLADFQRSECYMPPLKLEPATQDIYLQTRIMLEGNTFHHRLKNLNEQEKMVWRYKPASSYEPYAQKKGVLMGVLRKVAKMASDDAQFYESMGYKMREFAELGYSSGFLRSVCRQLDLKTKDRRFTMASYAIA